jgi:hypothetical protein
LITNGVFLTSIAGNLSHSNSGTTTQVDAHAIQSAAAASAEMLDKDPETRNTVYKMNMMEHEGPLLMNEDGTVVELAPPPVNVQMFR